MPTIGPHWFSAQFSAFYKSDALPLSSRLEILTQRWGDRRDWKSYRKKLVLSPADPSQINIARAPCLSETTRQKWVGNRDPLLMPFK